MTPRLLAVTAAPAGMAHPYLPPLPAPRRHAARLNGGRTLGDIHEDARERKRARRAGAWLCRNCYAPPSHQVDDDCEECGVPAEYTFTAEGRQWLAQWKRNNRQRRNLWLVDRGGLQAVAP